MKVYLTCGYHCGDGMEVLGAYSHPDAARDGLLEVLANDAKLYRIHPLRAEYAAGEDLPLQWEQLRGGAGERLLQLVPEGHPRHMAGWRTTDLWYEEWEVES